MKNTHTYSLQLLLYTFLTHSIISPFYDLTLYKTFLDIWMEF